MKNLVKTVTALCCCAMLAACERPDETAKTTLGRAAAISSSPTDDKNAVSALPEHFDRARTEQYEDEEDRLRERGRHN